MIHRYSSRRSPLKDFLAARLQGARRYDRIAGLACNSGLVDAINEKVHLLKRHLPHHESDHVLNITHNTLNGGSCLDDIELRRNDEAYMDALGAERIPDPTAAGDFTRRFGS